MELKIKPESFQSLAIKLLASNLAMTRKMCDFMIVSLSRGDIDLAGASIVQFRRESEVAIQVLIDTIYEHDGDISIDDILGKES